MFNWFNMKKKTLPQQVLKNTKDIEKLYDQELSDITQLNYKQDAEDSLTYADGKATFKGKMSIIRNENTQNLIVDSEIEVNISSGDDDIIIDAGEDNVSLKIRLDNDTRNKINRALLTPISAPSETEIVAVGTNNAQKMVSKSDLSFLPNSSSSSISGIIDITEGYHNFTAPADGYATVFVAGVSEGVDAFLANSTAGIEYTYPKVGNASLSVPLCKGDNMRFYLKPGLVPSQEYSTAIFRYARSI